MLCWHVDYWDYLGWKDPYGSKAFTERQRRYKKNLKLRVIGTPLGMMPRAAARAFRASLRCSQP